MRITHKTPANRARAAIEVLVSAPDSEVDVPVMKLEGDVAHGVSEVPADEDAEFLGVGSDAFYVEELACVELDSGEEEDGCCGGVGVDCGEDMLGCEQR